MKATADHGCVTRVSWCQAMLAAVAPQLLAYMLGRAVYGISVAPTALFINLCIAVGWLVWARTFARGPIALWLMGAVAAFAFHFVHVVKIAFLGEPLVAADIFASLALFDILKGWRRMVLIIGSVVVLAALSWSLWPKRGRGANCVFGTAIYLVMVVAVIVWAAGQAWFPLGDKLTLFQKVGGAVFIVINAKRYHESDDLPTYGEVAALISDTDNSRGESSSSFRKRNIHVLLMEAAWDVTQLHAYRFSEDPWDPRFRAMWRRGGKSQALSPVFGGSTANAEFELLCGLPAGDAAIAFQDSLRNDMPCLPRVLRASGYGAIASHPYKQEFWSRDKAYKLIGFESYYPRQAFESNDLDGGFLADTSLLRQVIQRYDASWSSRPAFNYVVTLSSHYPYERDRYRRPDAIQVTPALPLLNDYANSIRYTTSAAMDAVEAIHRKDPDAIIVMTGDHAPVLGSAPSPYRQSGLFLPGEATDGNQFAMLKTPLILLNGKDGPVPVGDVPMRRVPALILGLLGEGAPSLPTAKWEASQKSAWSSHVFLGKLFIRKEDGSWRGCEPGDPQCAAGLQQQKELSLLARDLLRGHRYAVGLLGAHDLLAPARMNIAAGSCSFHAVDWGPKETQQGVPFFEQADGSSAFWIKIEGSVRGDLGLDVGGSRADMLIAGTIASAAFKRPPFLSRPGKYPVTWRCGGKTAGRIGTLLVRTADQRKSTTTTVPAAGLKPDGTCRAKILDWGPREIRPGQSFNRQADGNSAYWLKVSEESKNFTLKLGRETIPTIRDGDTLTFTHDSIKRMASRSDSLNFELACGDRTAAAFRVLVKKRADIPR